VLKTAPLAELLDAIRRVAAGRRLFERFDLASRTELATRALREGWLDVPPGT
jgi:DNA-binding NarL/FixJ family response regulator